MSGDVKNDTEKNKTLNVSKICISRKTPQRTLNSSYAASEVIIDLQKEPGLYFLFLQIIHLSKTFISYCEIALSHSVLSSPAIEFINFYSVMKNIQISTLFFFE